MCSVRTQPLRGRILYTTRSLSPGLQSWGQELEGKSTYTTTSCTPAGVDMAHLYEGGLELQCISCVDIANSCQKSHLAEKHP